MFLSLLFFSLFLSLLPGTFPSAASVNDADGGTWEDVGDDWQFRMPDGSILTREWIQSGDDWYYMNREGYLTFGKALINSEYYYFFENGKMARGWAYDIDEDEWYFAREDGSLTQGWLLAGGAWYWFDGKCRMFRGGARMIDMVKYTFADNGQMTANRYVGLNYYDSEGKRDNSHNIKLSGKRVPGPEERDAVTAAFSEIPQSLVKQFIDDGWEILWYTDKKRFEAPRTERGIYQIQYKTDVHYKKLKFTDPSAIRMAFGEYLADRLRVTGKASAASARQGTVDTASSARRLIADYSMFAGGSSYAEPLPEYFADDPAIQFGALFADYCNPELRGEMRWEDPELLASIEGLLGIDRAGQKPDEENSWEMTQYGITAGVESGSSGPGPSSDENLKHPEAHGPAAEQ